MMCPADLIHLLIINYYPYKVSSKEDPRGRKNKFLAASTQALGFSSDSTWNIEQNL